MTDVELFMNRYKACVFSILSDVMNGQTSIRKCYKSLESILLTEFDTECVFFLYERGEWLHTVNGDGMRIGPVVRKQTIFFDDSYFMRADDSASIEALEKGDLLIPCNGEGWVKGFFVIRPAQQNTWIYHDEAVTEIARTTSELFQNIMKALTTAKEKERYQALFDVTEAFYSSMDVDMILQRVYDSLCEMFPQFTYSLLLSNDYTSDVALPVHYLDYQSGNEVVMKAFLTSEVTTELTEEHSVLYAPLRGKQGVYGLLQTTADRMHLFSDNEREFIKILSYTAGNAFENAMLYEQSQQVIGDLQLINDVSHQLNASTDLDEMMSFLNEQMIKAFRPSQIGFVLLNENDSVLLKGSTSFFEQSFSVRYLEFVEKQFKEGVDSLYLADLTVRVGEGYPYLSLMAVPMLHNEQLRGYCIVLHEEAYSFTFDTYKLFQSIIQHSTLAVVNSLLRHELQEMVNRDHLTGLYARSYLDRTVTESMKQDEKGVFILLDIDHFKSINDTYGHQQGDEVLVQLAGQLQELSHERGISARWGGEELALYLPGIGLDEGYKLIETMQKEAPYTTNPSVTLSCGVSYWSSNQQDSYKALFIRADEALYDAKESGRDRIVVNNEHTHEMNL